MDVFISDSVFFLDKNKIISNGFTRTGDVYLLNDEKVIKIYRTTNTEFNTLYKNELEQLQNLNVQKFITPIELVYDENENIIGYTMRYIKGSNGDSILDLNSKFFLEELEKVYDEMSILSKGNVVIDDVIADNVIVNENGLHFIDTDDYIIRTRLNYNKNMKDSNFAINIFLKEIFARMDLYKNNVNFNNMFDNEDIFYKEALKYYKPEETVKSLVKRMVDLKNK